MTEAGGATTQAGIYYQNSVAALQLAELLELRNVPARERVVGVRVEAPGDVDDIVVDFADGHRHFMSAKLLLRTGGKAWDNLWADLQAEANATTKRAGDRLLIVVARGSSTSNLIAQLSTLAASSIDSEEFNGRLTEAQRTLMEKIRPPKHSLDDRFEILRRVEVLILSEAEIEREFSLRRSDATSVAPVTLLALLRDLAGGNARTRQSFRAPALRQRLLDEHQVIVREPAEWGVDAYRDATLLAARIEIPGTGLSGPATDVILCPRHAPTNRGAAQLRPHCRAAIAS